MLIHSSEAALAAEARRQLKQEADYLHEADQIRAYRQLVGDDPTLLVPQVDSELTSAGVLAMSFIDSEPIDWLNARPQEERNRVAERLIRLTLQEVFAFGLIQTDPNFANFRYQPTSGRIVLFDFGATRVIPTELTAKLRVLFVHRKIGGIYLLASKLGARLDMRALLEEYATGTSEIPSQT